MTPFTQLLIISFSLAADSLSVSIAGGINAQKSKVTDAVRVAVVFGFFQGAMPVIGWMIGEVLTTFIAQFINWFAFLLLVIIGLKMIKESFEKEEKTKNILQTKTLIILAVATSIDALMVGITLGLLGLPILVSVVTIGIITTFLCFFGFLFGRRVGTVFGKRVEILGGIALIAIGIKILIEGL